MITKDNIVSIHKAELDIVMCNCFRNNSEEIKITFPFFLAPQYSS